MRLDCDIDEWALREPFVTSQEAIAHIETITVSVFDGPLRGRGEALGVDYLGETARSMVAQVEGARAAIEAGIEPEALMDVLPAGGARNAVDCALWDLRAKRSGRSVFALLGVPRRPVATVYTLSLDRPEAMAEAARRHAAYPILKLKLDRDDPAARLRAVRQVRPDADILVDANGAWSLEALCELVPELLAARVSMVEQPFPAGAEAGLQALELPVTLCADESCQTSADLARAADSYRLVNIKLDKCGGLTEALRMVRAARDLGLELMVGNMLGSSLAMAPAFLVAQFCRYVDLDGPLWQRRDRRPPIRYDGAWMSPPDRALWG